jgi:hypothetical protein
LTSDRQRRANRGNAKSGTGPKTPAGKGRVAQNAFRHGLNVSVLSDPYSRQRSKGWRMKSAAPTRTPRRWNGRGGSPKQNLTSTAYGISRRQLVTRLFVDPGFQPTQVHQQQLRVAKMVLGSKPSRTLPLVVDEVRDMLSPKPLEGEEKLASILEEKISEFAALDRYERRALSRRKAAIRNFDAARTLAVTQ